jgi:hypothetical protein
MWFRQMFAGFVVASGFEGTLFCEGRTRRRRNAVVHPSPGPLRGEHLRYSKFGEAAKLATLRQRRF